MLHPIEIDPSTGESPLSFPFFSNPPLEKIAPLDSVRGKFSSKVRASDKKSVIREREKRQQEELLGVDFRYSFKVRKCCISAGEDVMRRNGKYECAVTRILEERGEKDCDFTLCM